MPTTNEEFFTRERLQAIGLGIGRGFQSYDPNNPFAGAGAAMEATIGAEMIVDQRRKDRRERFEDLEIIRKEKLDAERRAEEASIREFDRRIEQAKKMGDIETQQMLERQRKSREELQDWYKKQQVVGISEGLAKKKSPGFPQYLNLLANLLGGNKPRIKGNAPINLFDESMTMEPATAEYRPSPMRRPLGVEMMRGDEDFGSTQPNPSGARNTYIDSKGIKRYADTGQPFGMF
jgi:hypothetical protein